MNSFRDEGRQGTVVRSRPQFLPEFHSNAEFSQGKLYEPSPLTYDININYMSMINIDIDWSKYSKVGQYRRQKMYLKCYKCKNYMLRHSWSYSGRSGLQLLRQAPVPVAGVGSPPLPFTLRIPRDPAVQRPHLTAVLAAVQFVQFREETFLLRP